MRPHLPRKEADGGADRRALRAEIARVASEAGRKAIAGQAFDAEARQLEALQKIDAALPARKSNVFGAAAAIGAVCVLGVSLASSIKVASTRIQLDVLSTQVNLQLVGNLDWSGDLRLKPSRIRLERFSRFDLPNDYEHPPELKDGSSLDILAPAGAIRLAHLFIGSNAQLTLDGDDTGATDVVVRGGPFRGDIDVNGEVAIEARPPPSAAFPSKNFVLTEPPGRFGFQFTGKAPNGTPNSSIPATLHAEPIDPVAFTDVPMRNISFFEERDDDTKPAFASQIVSGSLVMTDTGEQVPLGAGASLRLVGADGIASAVKLGGKGVQLRFEGTTRDITLGTGLFRRDLKPTLLEWLFHQRTLSFVWTALASAFGIAWSARKLLQGGE